MKSISKDLFQLENSDSVLYIEIFPEIRSDYVSRNSGGSAYHSLGFGRGGARDRELEWYSREIMVEAV